MTQEAKTTTAQVETAQPTEAQIKGEEIKASLVAALQEAFPAALPGYLEDGTYVDVVGHSSPHKREGIIIKTEEVDVNPALSSTIRKITALDRSGISIVTYSQRNSFHPAPPTYAQEIPLERYPTYKQSAIQAIAEAPRGPKPPANP